MSSLLSLCLLVIQVPLHERVELHQPNAQGGGWMGEAVAMDGTRVLCGTPFDDTNSLHGGWDAGTARLFEREAAGTWSQVVRLRASDGASGDQFGTSVALAGDRALIGADQKDTFRGAAYVFERDPLGVWTETARLVPAVRGQDYFGQEVALSGTRALVGAHLNADRGFESGAAYVFDRNPNGTWSQVAELFAGDGAAGDAFGSAVAIDADRALIGAPGAHGLGYLGACYVFERQGNGTWLETAKLTSGEMSFGSSSFGGSVSLSDERALVGDRVVGAAFIFEHGAGGAWTRRARLAGSAVDFFGCDVSLGRDRAVVGGYWHSAAHLFERSSSGDWTEINELIHAQQGDWFGYSVAISGDWIAVGAPQDGDVQTRSGSATVFKLPSPAHSFGPGVSGPPLVSILVSSWLPFDADTRHIGAGSHIVPLFVLPRIE